MVEEGEFLLGEAIITRAGAVYDENSVKMGWKLYTEVITENTTYTVPSCRNQELTVMCFGGGGGYYNKNSSGGGGSGYMNKQVVSLAAGQSVQITIGSGGGANGNGGTTSFGSYLSANGGEHGKQNDGGNGGAGGGGFGNHYGANGSGGIGYNFGGGGAGGVNKYGGNGGYYGGQGGHVIGAYYASGWPNGNTFSVNKSTLGGSSGTIKILNNAGSTMSSVLSVINPTNGTVYENNSKEALNGLETKALAGNSFIGGYQYQDYGFVFGFASGGGGGYGGCGGSAVGINSHSSYPRSYGGGGGGGYGANGGNAVGNTYTGVAGGGGGYGDKGGDGAISGNNNCYGGYGGGYSASGYGRGGTRKSNTSGKNGVCIIQYYGIVYE